MSLIACSKEGCTNVLRTGLPHLASDPWFCGEHEPKKSFTGPLPKCAVETCAARAMGEDTLCSFHKEKGEPMRFLNKGIPLEQYGKSPAEDILKDIKELKKHTVNQDTVVDLVNSPPHYNQGGVECIDAIEAVIGSAALQDHCIATAIKYLWRWKHKNGVQDLRKAIWYINKAIDTKIMEQK